MPKEVEALNLTQAVAALDSPTGVKNLSAEARENVRRWLTEDRYAEFAPQVAEHIAAGRWQALDDAFWTVIPFGTGGRRGRMYPIGCNAINVRTIGESARGLAEYVKEQTASANLSCAIAYDTRHKSSDFARLCAEIMVAAGFQVFFLGEYRSTPELSYLVRYKQCSCGIMVTASHNPPSDNAVKCYWSTGGQILPPHDQGVIDNVMQVEDIPRAEFDTAVSEGNIVICQDEVDAAFINTVVAERFDGPRDLRIIYSPLHGVGLTAVEPVLKADGFTDVEIYEPHASPDGDFPNVPNHVANPENSEVFSDIITYARDVEADIILATDPDCDRLGCAAPLATDSSGTWATFSGNQIGALLADFVLDKRRQNGSISAEHFVVKTLVTTEMVKHIADSYGVRTIGKLLVGFKWIGGAIDEFGPEKFVFGTEESHGYLVGHYARDKDAAVAAMLMSELAAQVKADGQTLHEKLDALYWQHGYHAERTLNLKMTGFEGMARMKALMATFRAEPPLKLAGLDIVRVRDYQRGEQWAPGESPTSLVGPQGNMVIMDLAEKGNYIAVRPSGTEPKVKLYEFTFVPAEQLANLETAKAEMQQRLDQFESDLRSYAGSV